MVSLPTVLIRNSNYRHVYCNNIIISRYTDWRVLNLHNWSVWLESNSGEGEGVFFFLSFVFVFRGLEATAEQQADTAVSTAPLLRRLQTFVELITLVFRLERDTEGI